MRRVDPLDVEGRIGLRVAQPLRLGEHRSERQSLRAHLGKDEIAGAVDDAGDPLDAVRDQPFAQHLDGRDAAGDGCFEGDHHAARARCGEDLVAVKCEQRLVGGDDVLAVRDRREDRVLGDAGAADRLDDDIDGRIGRRRDGIAGDRDARSGDATRAFEVAGAHPGDLDAPSGASGDLFAIALENAVRSAADRAEPEQAQLDGRLRAQAWLDRNEMMSWRVTTPAGLPSSVTTIAEFAMVSSL